MTFFSELIENQLFLNVIQNMLYFCDDTDVEYIHTTTFSNFSYFIKPSFVLKLNIQIIDVISIQYF